MITDIDGTQAGREGVLGERGQNKQTTENERTRSTSHHIKYICVYICLYIYNKSFIRRQFLHNIN